MSRIKITDIKKNHLGDFYGIFFEDLNHAADGGLYGELIRNRSFSFSPIDNPVYNGLTAWIEHEPCGTSVSLSISNKQPYSSENPHYLVMDVKTNGVDAGVRNEGYNSGIPLYGGKTYKLKFFARSGSSSSVTVSIASAEGVIYDSRQFNLCDEWKEYSAELIPPSDDFSARLLITMNKSGKACFDYVSLFPKDTYKGRENGLRRDIAEMLADLKPKFMRFPGGCLVHDGSLNDNDRDSCYRWKKTIGDTRNRPARRNNWRYNQSLGLGYYEYFLFCEDIGAEPLPVLPAGYNPHSRQGVPVDELGEWIDDALDLIEFANGGTDTKWGAVRAELGHSEPFGLKYIAIGNEEVGQGFFDRYDYFHKAVKEKYPDIKIINSAGPFNHGSEYERGWNSARKNGSDLIDEHYYMEPDWLLANYDRYANYDPDGPKVFLGEYASWGNTYYNALAEAAYMTGLENNSHAVALACYAPLLANVQYVNWEPDMIWFDNHRVFGTANYYVQKMFMNNLPDHLLESKYIGEEKTTPHGIARISGGIRIAADRIGAEFENILVTDCDTGKVTDYGNRSFENGGEFTLCDMDSDRYIVELDAVRTSGDLGFKVTFGYNGDTDRYIWSVGGWQNQDCCVDKFGKSASCLTQNRFSVETGRTYKLRLEVEKRHIRTYINGELANDIEDKQLITKELYFTAGSDDKTGDIIFKAVNVNETETTSEIELPITGMIDAEITELSGYEKGDMNSFEEPCKIYPKKSRLESGNSIIHTFPPMSVTVMRIRTK